ncbi:MAG: acetone carboxylase [Nocardioidaceae bacterium]|nr:acetone carboxylase [Nocardioidaceae bacterium]
MAETATEPLTCSSKGCQAAAHYAVLWNNPKIHTPERRKTWLACPEHEMTLRAFLSARGFYRETRPVDAL